MWVKTVYKSYQHTTKVATNGERVKTKNNNNNNNNNNKTLLFKLQHQKAYLQTNASSEDSNHITKTRLFKYIENFTTKSWNFSDKNSDIFIFLLKT